MTEETRRKFFKIYMDKGEKDKAYAIYKGHPPADLIGKKEEVKKEKK